MVRLVMPGEADGHGRISGSFVVVALVTVLLSFTSPRTGQVPLFWPRLGLVPG